MLATSLIPNGDYTVESELGQGGFGCALLVRRTSDGGLFVMKDIRLSRLSTMTVDGTNDRAQLLKIAQKEAELMTSVAHPNIVRIFESFSNGDHFYIIMEYCESGTLKDAIKARNGELFPEEHISNWVVQLALTLKYIHDRKILHRDIKSENVFLTCGGRVIKLGDFGIAKSIEQTEQSAYTGVGTVAYSSPEHCEGRGYSHKSEVWAFGILIYELAALHLPFRITEANGSYMQLFVKICKMEPEPVPDKYSSELKDLILQKLLKKDPNDRPQIAEVVLHPFIAKAVAELTIRGANETFGDDEESPLSRSPSPSRRSSAVSSSSFSLNDEDHDSVLAAQMTTDLEYIAQSKAVDEAYKAEICATIKQHKLTLALLKELSDEEIAEIFPEVGPRKAVKKFIDAAKKQSKRQSYDVLIEENLLNMAAMKSTFKKFFPGGSKMMKKAIAAEDTLFKVSHKAMARLSLGAPKNHHEKRGSDFVTYSIYSSWSSNSPKEPFELASPTAAILISPSQSDNSSTTALVATLVGSTGEIVSSPISTEGGTYAIEWRGRVNLPEKRIINYATIDGSSGDIFFTILGDPCNREIFFANRNAIALRASKVLASSDNDSSVPLAKFVSSSAGGNRIFVGLAVDSMKHQLFACAPLQGDITIWSLLPEARGKQQVPLAIVNCHSLKNGVNPYCCALFSSTKAGRTLLAVCDTMENYINLFVREDSGDNAFYFATVIAHSNQGNPAAVGSIFWPNDITFDEEGNLAVSDSENYRIQVFALHNSSNDEIWKPRAIWASPQQRARITRVAVATKTCITSSSPVMANSPLAIVALTSATENPVLWFE